MAAPNLASASASVIGKSDPFALTNTQASVLRSVGGHTYVPANHCYRLSSLFVTNISGAVPWVTWLHWRSSVLVEGVYQMAVPITGAFNLMGGRYLYLEEGDDLYLQADASSHITGVASYEDCS